MPGRVGLVGRSNSRFPLSGLGDWARRAPQGFWIQAAGVAVLAGILVIELRNAFSQGTLVTPDLFRSFPAVPSFNDLGTYASKWSPANLGGESAQPSGVGVLAVLASVGLVGSGLEAAFVLASIVAGLAAVWSLAKSHLRNATLAPVAPILYVLSPTLFIVLFDANIQFVLYALLPVVFLLTLDVCRNPRWRGAAWLAVSVGLACAFVPFTPILILPAMLTVLVASQVSDPSKPRLLKSCGGLLLSLGAAILINAPYYLGNLPYFASEGIAGAPQENIPLVSMTYGWSNPANLLSLAGAGLYPRYAQFYPPLAIASLFALPCVAILGLRHLNGAKGVDLRLSLGLLAAGSVAWVWATRLGWTSWLFSLVPYLLVFNYPTVFYLNSALAFVVLGVLGLDEIEHWSTTVFPGRALSASDPSRLAGWRATFRNAAVELTNHAGILATVFLLLASAGPASFYLSTGDFRLSEAPTQMGFPPQWSSTAPASFARISTFIQTNGGDGLARSLILPAPAFSGGNTLPGYSLNLFDQKQFQNSSYTGPFFLVPSSQAFATSVLDYLIANRTQVVGLALGQASVRFVFVDKELNFTGPPRWEWGSLVGSPKAFLDLLDQQKDLRRTYEDSLIVVFENMDFQPYVQPYRGVLLVRTGATGTRVRDKVFSWGFSKSDWGSPLPPSQIANVTPVPDGYLVTASGGAGDARIEFNATPNSSSLTSHSSRLDATALYLTSTLAPVTDQAYLVTYDADYSGPASHTGGLVFVAGWDSDVHFLWQTAPCCPGPPGHTSGNISIDPLLQDPATEFVTITAMLPVQFGSAGNTTFRLSNASLVATTRPPPETSLAPILVGQLPSDYAPRLDASVLWDNLSAVARQEVANADIPVDRICLGICPDDGSGPWDQLIFAYNSLGDPANASSRNRNPAALPGAEFDSVGPATETLTLAGYPFRSVYVRARGNGTITMPSGASVTLSRTDYQWYSWTLTTLWSNSTLTISTTGAVDLDTFLLTAQQASPNGTVAGANLSVSLSEASLTSYQGETTGAPGALLLSQSFNQGWTLRVGGIDLTPVPATGWATLFILPREASTVAAARFAITFGPQAEHETLMVIQAAAILVVSSYALLPAVRRLIIRGRKIVHALNSVE